MTRASRSLLETVQGLLERTYAMRSRLGDPAPYIIGDEGYRLMFGREELTYRVTDSPAVGAKTLVRDTPEGVRACIYYPDAMIRALERHPPQDKLYDANVDAFAALVEELDHLLCIAERSALGRSCTLFELELHANVSKYLVLTRFLAGDGTRSVAAGCRIWVLYHLFHKNVWSDPDPDVRARYREATRWGVRFLSGLRRVDRPERRVSILRQFHEAPAEGKIALIEALPDSLPGGEA